METEIVIKLIKKEIKTFKRTALMSYENNPFTVLISCILSLRTRDETTEKASAKLFSIAKTPKEMVKLSIKQIEKSIYPVGFYKTKAKRIKDICDVLIKNYNSNVPNKMEELLKLKGVGRKTANIVLVYGHGKKYHIPVDTHVHRIPNRLGWVHTKTPEQTEIELMKIVPKKYWRDLNDNFVQFGQNICRPIGPKCDICPVNKYCDYFKNIYKKNR